MRAGVVITAPNVTLENCRVAATSWDGIVVEGAGAVIEICEVISIDPSGGTKGVLFDDAATGGVVRGCDSASRWRHERRDPP
jgi:hypothetical protein